MLFAALWASLLTAIPVSPAEGPGGGILAGVTASIVDVGGSGAAGLDTGVKMGGFAGGFALFPVTRTIAIRPEVLYSRKRFTLKDPARAFAATDAWDWVEARILLQISLTRV